ncbi:Peptidase family M50 [Virgibacillus subterraneus]|uniref:Peptidase family M50 n=1 Tax=Virgibacillus subterraneus TaxID=621109 RepID=A0A1H9JVF3_9BACI|nr:site-2 protease family protein [Virgibacillus subterraneus]SEQ90906.1 Peptidase family M50 [Virgibacillus subterraneus]
MEMILFIIFYIVATPLSVLLHEVGHAVGIIAFTRENARVFLGPANKSNKEVFKIGRMHFHITLAFFGYCNFSKGDEKQTNFQRGIIAAGGPIMSLLLSILFYIISIYTTQPEIGKFAAGISLFNMLNFLLTIIPIKYPKWWGPYKGFPSDGYRIYMAVKK